MIPKIPKKYCNQSVILRKLTGKDEWQNKLFEPDVTLINVIFQSETIYSGSNNSREVVATGIVYLFNSIAEPFPLIIAGKHEGSEIEFEGRTYVVEKIVDNRNPFDNTVYSYELEVI